MDFGVWRLDCVTPARTSAFVENGASGDNLTVDARTARNTTLSSDLRAVRSFGNGDLPAGFYLRFAGSHLHGDNDAPVGASLSGQGAGFRSDGTSLKWDAVGAGLTQRYRLSQRELRVPRR